MRLQTPFTLALIAASVLVSLISRFGMDLDALQLFFITSFVVSAQGMSYHANLPEIWQGEVWRLITPIFIHFGVIHILFNMLWLWDLGRAIERRESSQRILFLVLCFGILSNVGQFYATGPQFGGMSGVVYGLLGYLWIRGKKDPFYGLRLRPEIVVMMLIWFVLCWLGWVGNIGNVSHTVGLGLGISLGFISARQTLRQQ
ncbi:MAG: rhomboid family intramembrane serine protease [Gammaproteobacteria bacterium]|nr:rhomboid family intramembrane serine protease [Gammaproteobacteria bacterium]